MSERSGLITSQTTYNKDYSTDFHYHENPHLTFVLHGGNMEYRGQQVVRKDAGTVLFYHSGELHRTLPTIPSTRNLNIEIDLGFLRRHSLEEHNLKNAVDSNSFRRFFMLKMHQELLINDSVTEAGLHALLLSFVKGGKVASFRSIEWCASLKELLNDEWNINHSLSDLSSRLGVHPVTISKHFGKYFGTTLGEYIRRIRIDKSLELIKSTSLSLTEIAFLCGFSDQSHFIRAFRQQTGITPKYFQRL